MKIYYWESEELLLGEWKVVTEGVKSSTWEREGKDGNTDVTTNIFAMLVSGTYRVGFCIFDIYKKLGGVSLEENV